MTNGSGAGCQAAAPQGRHGIRGGKNFQGGPSSAPFFTQRPASDLHVREIMLPGVPQIRFHSEPHPFAPVAMSGDGGLKYFKVFERNRIRMYEITGTSYCRVIIGLQEQVPTLFVATHREAAIFIQFPWLNGS